MMWNATLAGALCYIPVTRQDKKLTAYGVYPVQWKSWVRAEVGVEAKAKLTYSMVEKLLHKYNIDYTEEMLSDEHCRDAICIGVFGIHGADQNEHETSSTLN
jgi:hypothetical protein